MTKLVLGTAQFGTNYGATNIVGHLADEEVRRIFKVALQNGIDSLDTAQAYGDAESRIGELSGSSKQFNVISKFSTSALPPEKESLYLATKIRLKSQRLSALLFHNATDLFGQFGNLSLEILREARRNNEISKIGVSIYTLNDLKKTLDVFPDLDLVQLPANILDLKLLSSPEISALRDKGVEIHVRSIYLQGLLLRDPEKLETWQSPIKFALKELNLYCNENNISLMQLAISAIKFHPNTSSVVVGVTGHRELSETIASWKSCEETVTPLLTEVSSIFLDPRNWPLIRSNS